MGGEPPRQAAERRWTEELSLAKLSRAKEVARLD